MQRKEKQIGRLQELVSRQAAAAAPVSQDPPAPVALAPTVAAAPATTPHVPGTSPMASGSSGLDSTALEAEQDRSLAVLTAFKRFHPPTFDEEVVDPWVMEVWLTSMEALFEDIYTSEKDKVHLAAHCFEKSAQVWWRRVKKN
uniref:Retrotransposon gag domain-containing protein n=1 Tax=Ananas comosus var. bracteatus TaxID=296719 RepID=A0A6V7PXW9_ANACO|nr:unnamed protein product [Ananas comosus var. bracteatus]